MKRDEFENWLKDEWENVPFEGNESDWEKLEARLPTQSRKSLFFLPLKIVAGLALPVIGLYWFFNKENNTIPSPPIQKETIVRNQLLDTLKQTHTTTNFFATNTTNASQHLTSIRTINKKNYSNSKNNFHLSNFHPTDENKNSYHTEDTIQTTTYPPQEEFVQNKSTHENSLETIPHPNVHQNNIPDYKKKLPEQPMLGYALYAGIGSTNISPLQFQTGLSAHLDVTEKLRLNASIGIQYAQVGIQQNYIFTGIHADIDNSSVPDGNYNNMETNMQIDYRNSIYSVGIQPGITYKIHKKWNITVGFYTHKNMNTEIQIQTDTDSRSMQLMDNGIFPSTQNIEKWNYGWTGELEYQLYPKLSLHAQYRHGMNTYIKSNHQNIRSTGIQVGIKFYNR